MSEIEIIEKMGSDAVRKLRKLKLEAGKPFLIHSKDLPQQHSYMEFPDQSIKIVTVSSNKREFTIVNILSSNEVNTLRKKYSLTK